ncbi:uncharacterized protein LOC124947296 [Vespa velutina]|uniref:uncharacterized protein LOC124947296 n=1 Tax=Vespa velutina TaxID=202808 RepID=UPI001FB36434|nr:uncharacterized protein LOC124947296 [Vespa velutina]
MSDTVNEDAGCSSSLEKRWTRSEKLLLLKGLKLYSHKNVASISTLIPNRSQENIEAMINELKIKSKAIKKDKQPLINNWLQSEPFKNKNTLIRQALLFICLFEKHSSSTDRIYDYREIYRFLYKLSCGCEIPKLSDQNQEILYESLSEVIQKITNTHHQDVILYLEKLLNQKKNVKTYSGKKTSK